MAAGHTPLKERREVERLPRRGEPLEPLGKPLAVRAKIRLFRQKDRAGVELLEQFQHRAILLLEQLLRHMHRVVG